MAILEAFAVGEGPLTGPDPPAIVEANGMVWLGERSCGHVAHGCSEVIVELGASFVREGVGDGCTKLGEDCGAEDREVGELAVSEDVVKGVIFRAEWALCDAVGLFMRCIRVGGFGLVTSVPTFVIGDALPDDSMCHRFLGEGAESGCILDRH